MPLEDAISPHIVLTPSEQFGARALEGEESAKYTLRITKNIRQWLIAKRSASPTLKDKLRDIPDEELVKNAAQYLRKEYAIEVPLTFETTDVLLNISVKESDIPSIVALVQANSVRRKENERKRKNVKIKTTPEAAR